MSDAALQFDRSEVAATRSVLLAVTVLVLHVALIGRLTVLAVHPETMLVLAVIGGLELGPSGGAFLGFAAGFGNDLLAATPLGLWALIGAFAAVVAGEVRRRAFVTVRERLPMMLVVVGVSVALVVYTVLSYVVAEQPIPLIQRMLTILAVSAGWSALLTWPVRKLVKRVATIGTTA